jgi:hypothetical protein
MDEDFFEKRFIRTSTSISELESQFCETDWEDISYQTNRKLKNNFDDAFLIF